MNSAINSCWVRTREADLMQGDWLPNCLVSNFDPDLLGPLAGKSIYARIRTRLGLESKQQVNVAPIEEVDLIIATQSCDMVIDEGYNLALCRIMLVAEFEEVNPKFKKKGMWQEVDKGRKRGLYLLPSPTNPGNEKEALVVDFREIYALPYRYILRHARELEPRWRLQSPWREHFSHEFGDFFSRVAKP